MRMHQLRRFDLTRLVRALHINEGDEYAKTFWAEVPYGGPDVCVRDLT